MSSPTSLLLRFVGVSLHLMTLLFSLGIAFVAGFEVMYVAGRLTEAGVLAGLAIGMNFAGGLSFLVYRPANLWKATLLVTELLVFAGSLTWLSIDFAVVAGATLATALALVLQRVSKLKVP